MIKSFLTVPVCLILSASGYSQIFSRVTSTSNPVIADSPSQNPFTGCTWVDIDNDGLLDLFICQNSTIYRNSGGGNFSRRTGILNGQHTNTSGNTWADYDNDGYTDCYISTGMPYGSKLYHNNGDTTFSIITSGVIGNAPSNPSSAAAWGDYDNDGRVDLVLAAPNGFVGNGVYNKLYHNGGSNAFTNTAPSPVTDSLNTFTNPSWSDYDMDGDLDLFFGTGPVTKKGVDLLFENKLVPNSSATFQRITSAPLSTDLRDGQLWNWIDYDNDGDFDAFVTNYNGGITAGLPNDFYQNNGGAFSRLTSSVVGAIVADTGHSLASVWMDFDNDGDLDCFVTREGQKNRFYVNRLIPTGIADFTNNSIEPMATIAGNHYSASAGDYDNDGDVDLFVTGTSSASQGLYENISSSNNNWINIKTVGISSNRSGIGVRVKAKAVINGVPVWQVREVNSQNSTYGMNMLNVHFGLGNAILIDTLITIWPSGTRDTCYNVLPNSFYTATEGDCLLTVNNRELKTDEIQDVLIFPNPTNKLLNIEFSLNKAENITVTITDSQGRPVKKLPDQNFMQGKNVTQLTVDHLLRGTYFCQIISKNGAKVLKWIKN